MFPYIYIDTSIYKSRLFKHLECQLTQSYGASSEGVGDLRNDTKSKVSN